MASIAKWVADAVPPTAAQATETTISVTESDDHQAKAQAQEHEDVKLETQRLERWANAVGDSFQVGLTSQSATLQKAIYLNLNAIATALSKLLIFLFLTLTATTYSICCRRNVDPSQAV